eukprot:GFYU01034624.1.p2 GENE.GFYU01034624.1~~GFYU01034624.1.p2  ORF type:complete len:160 (-),score=30.69 GFYU01034624.1:49-528(-)
MTTSAKGSCFCKKVEFSCEGQPTFSSICHCHICQRYTGGTSVHCVGFPPDNVKILKGEEYLKPFKTSEHMTRYFCKECSGSVYNESHMEDYPFKDVVASAFERDEDGTIKVLKEDAYKPSCHMFYTRRMIDAKDDLPKFVEYPGMSEKFDEDCTGQCKE